MLYPEQKHWAENKLMQLLQEAKKVSLAIQWRAVASCQASLSRHLHCPPPPLLPAHVFADGTWWLARELASSCLQVTSPEDSEFFVSRLSGLENLYPKKGKEVRPLLGEFPSFLAQLPLLEQGPPQAQHPEWISYALSLAAWVPSLVT